MDQYSKEPYDHLSLPSSDPFQSPTRWWSKETVAIVTGANKGIGFALVKRLAEIGLTLILTARDLERGSKAVESLKRQGLFVHFFRLDVSDPASIQAFVSWFSQNFPALDILINNAGISYNEIGENSVKQAERVMKTNFFGAKLLTQSLLPFFRRSSSSSRLLNITSRLGSLDKMRNPSIKAILASKDLSEEQIEGVVNSFLNDVKNGVWESRGWPEMWTDYAVSKLALSAYSRVLAKRYAGLGLSVNCYCPGFTQTAMTHGKGTHTADDAAETGARLALLPPHQLPSGKFFVWANNNTATFLDSKL
ncbi:(+)-neomenthol dehydrogenase [Morus notabilis]|uniref:(+)-neomenthol dehydrogenase n=1 Tax=Morus notabilis TaxID=981085 RepID=W9RF82_9ROSA|nr:(+)-neomenthol dehydrogenase isoform X1 [Morus notabilis]EXB88317.1 (+)-neomenthol dehydrogenase [Morus notabilis]